MKWNKWIDKWTALPRGQRRATIILLIVAGILCIVQLIASHIRQTPHPNPTDYTQLEEEIRLFREELDTVPLSNRRPQYIRRTHARYDSTYPTTLPASAAKTHYNTPQVRPIEAVPRIDSDRNKEEEKQNHKN